MLTHRDVAEKFVQGEVAVGDHMYSYHPVRNEKPIVLYSYSTPIAYFYDDDWPIFFDETGYSTSTRIQQSKIRQAAKIAGKECVLMPQSEFREKLKLLGVNLGATRD
jgi:hypothetical protein